MTIQNGLQNDRPSNEKVSNVKFATPAYDDIKKDLSSLQTDAAHLAANVKKAGVDTANNAVNYVSEQIGPVKDIGANTVGAIEERIKSKPGQSITIAFAAGLLVSYLFGRR